MVEIQVAYEGSLRCRATHGPSSRELITDAPVDNCGKGESFSPTDLVAAALGSCALTIMGIVADRNGWPLEDLQVRVVKHMVADPARRIARLEVLVQGGAGLDERARTSLEAAALGCPVNQSLGERTERDFQFRWGS